MVAWSSLTPRSSSRSTALGKGELVPAGVAALRVEPPTARRYNLQVMATGSKPARLRIAVSLAGDEAAMIARAAAGARQRPTTWARQALLKAAERPEPIVAEGAARLMTQQKRIPGGRERAALVEGHRREGWSRDRR
jgi:hypothetical protein